MVIEYTSLVDIESLESHCTKHEPFVVRQFYPYGDDLLQELLHNDTEVNISCSERSTEFHGDITKSEHVTMLVSSYMSGFMARKNGESHWMDGLDIDLYLSQIPLQQINVQHTIPSFLASRNVAEVNVWANIAPVTTACHYDGYHNMLCVIEGKKSVFLCSPQHAGSLQPNPSYAFSPNHASQSALMMSTVTLCAGDALFIPEGYWHKVQSDLCTLAVNYWFSSAVSFTLTPCMAPYLLRSSIHVLINDRIAAEIKQARDSISLLPLECQALLTIIAANAPLSYSEQVRFVSLGVETMLEQWIPFAQQVRCHNTNNT